MTCCCLRVGRQIMVASPVLVQRHGAPAAPSDLARFDSVAMSAIDGRAVWSLLDPGGTLQQITHQPRYVADDLSTLKMAVVAGVGVCWLPDYWCQSELEDGRLVHILPDWAPAPGILHAVFPSRRGLAPAVRCFLDFLGEVLAQHPGWDTQQLG